jgi:hypothetical protein
MEEGTPSGGAGNVKAGRSRGRLALAGLVALVLSATPADGPRDAFGAAELAPGR